MVKAPLKLVAVHLGAGKCHNEEESLNLAKAICEEVMFKTNDQPDINRSEQESNSCLLFESEVVADLAAVRLVKLMEDHKALNCGYGSNLNLNGQVECDASLMSDKTQLWAGVGATSGCKNPILLAKSLYDHQWTHRPLRLVQPNLLVGSGARQWMRENCPHLLIKDSKMISPQSFSRYQKFKSLYDAEVQLMKQKEDSHKQLFNSFVRESDENLHRDEGNYSDRISVIPDTNKQMPANLDHGFYCITTGENLKRSLSLGVDSFTPHKESEQVHFGDVIDSPSSHIEGKNKFLCDRIDTVGAIAVDIENNFTSAISSGGLLLKLKGRLGQAAVPGAGCWAQDSVAVTTTGVGEYLTNNLFAKKFHEKILTLRLLYDLGYVEKKLDLSDLITCRIEECFKDLADSPSFMHKLPQDRLAGMLSVSTINSRQSPKRVESNDLYVSYAHNTDSMCIGYMSSNDNVGNSLISRRQQGENDNKALSNTLRFSFS